MTANSSGDNGLLYAASEVFASRTVQEVHIDFLLEEEFSADPRFLLHFIGAAGREHTAVRIDHVDRSVSDQWGEADLVVVYMCPADGQKVALLIEDKIRAGFQPHQSDRYKKRGAAGIEEGRWNEFWTCLVAPKAYIDQKSDHGFDSAVKLEEVKGWLAVAEPARHEFKCMVIEKAIQKCMANGVQRVDAEMTEFRKRYYWLFEEFFAEQRQDVEMRQPVDTWWGDSWFVVRSRLLPKNAYINHKSQPGYVDLTFPATNSTILQSMEPYLEAGMRIEQTGKSAAFRLVVGKIEQYSNFDIERPRVAEALASVRRLLCFYVRERSRLEPILTGARDALATAGEEGGASK